MGLLSLPDELTKLQTLSKQADIVPGMLDIGSDFEVKLRLYLASNLLTQLPSPILTLQNLRVLSLRHNNITSIPPSIRELVNLESLNLAGNQLNELPFEIIELAKFHNLNTLIANPNPWRGMEESFENGVSSSNGFTCHTIVPFRSDITPTTLYRTKARGKLNNFRFYITKTAVPPLTETVLRQLSKLLSKSQTDLSTVMPHDSPQTVLDNLRLLSYQPERQCTTCHRTLVIAGEEWLEWWAIQPVGNTIPPSTQQMLPVPFRRLVCSSSCEGRQNDWCDVDSSSRPQDTRS